MRTDEDFRILIGSLTTLYAVKQRKVQGLNARSFKAAKERVVTFCAKIVPWAVQGATGDRRWGRGPLHQDGAVEGRKDEGAMGSLGRRSGGLRSHSCPSCGSPARALFRQGTRTACPSCAGRRQAGHDSGPRSAVGGHQRVAAVDETTVAPQALTAILEVDDDDR